MSKPIMRIVTAAALLGLVPAPAPAQTWPANPAAGIRTVADLIAQAKAKPGALNYSSGGTGNFSHLGLELLAFQAGIKLTHVPYRGVAPATMALLAGDVQLMYNNVATALEHVRAGKMVALAVGEAQRLSALPDIPAIA